MTIEKILQDASKKIYEFRHPSLLSLIIFKIIKTIINTGFCTGILRFCVRWNLYKLFRFFIGCGANVDTANKKGNTALHIASQYGPTAIAEVVVLMSKRVSAKNIDGDTPLHYSIKYKQLYVMQDLLQSSADIGCQNHLGETPLHTAVKYADGVTLGLLIKGGADLEIKDKEESTPLHLAVLSNHKDSVEILLRNGANVNAIGKSGCTPLHLAVMKGNKDIVELLLDKKANFHLKCFYNSKEGYTALENAIANRSEEIVALFLLHGITLK